MKNMSNECHKYKMLINKWIDGEISDSEKAELEAHVQTCQNCQIEFEKFKNLKEETMHMKKQLLPDMAWDEYWNHLYNRLERGIGWILVSIAAIIFLGFAAYHFMMDFLQSPEIPFIEKFAVTALIAGGLVLFVSVLREKLMTRKHDKYKEIQR